MKVGQFPTRPVASRLERPASAKHNYIALDGIRGVAALCVVVYHASGLFAATQIVPHGYLAVDLFFMLSGFVIAHSYDARFASGLGVGAFMRMRYERLGPAYLIALAIAVAGFALSDLAAHRALGPAGPIVAALVLQALLLPVPTGISGAALLYPHNPAAWSIFYELIANVAFALLMRFGRGGRHALTAVILASGAALVALGIAHGGLDAGPGWPEIPVALARVSFGFALGVFLKRHGRALDVLPRMPAGLAIAAAVIVLIAPKGQHPAVYDLACVLVAFPLLILCAARDVAIAPIARGCAALGALSYPLYILHTPLLYLFTGAGVHALGLGVEAMRPWGGAGVVLAIVAAAALIERGAERPVLRRFRDARRRPRAGGAPRRRLATPATGRRAAR